MLFLTFLLWLSIPVVGILAVAGVPVISGVTVVPYITSVVVVYIVPVLLAILGVTELEFLNNLWGARNRVGIGLSYRPDRLHRLAELLPWNRFLGSINV
jgi:hypothetical protein